MELQIRPQGKFSLGLKELWEYRELFFFFTLRDIKVKYKQTVLGILWAVLQPLIMALLFTFCLGKAISNYTHLDLPYDVFSFSGLVLWGIFSNGLNNAGNSMITHANIIKKIYFPRLIIPISSVLVALFDFLMALVVFVFFCVMRGIDLSVWSLFYFVLAALLACIATFGTGTLLASLNVKYRDFRYITPFLVQFFLFVSPVIYPETITVNPVLEWVMKLNPMSAPLEIFRAGLTGGGVYWLGIMPGIATSFLLLMIGITYFRKTEAYFADLA
jgi:lipopolysaccharide transport system permease protein